jgi:hypothetical protein
VKQDKNKRIAIIKYNLLNSPGKYSLQKLFSIDEIRQNKIWVIRDFGQENLN